MADIRIIDQQELTSLENGAYVVTDNSSDGTKKYNLKRLDTAIAGVNADLEEAVTAIENGTHDNLISGSAKQLLSDKYTVDQVPYTFRASGSSGADREYDEIVGGSVVWNQFCQNGNFENTTAWAGQQSTLSIANNTATLTKTETETSAALRRSNASYPQSTGGKSFANHVYFSGATVKTPKTTTARFYVFTKLANTVNVTANVETFVGGVVKLDGNSDSGLNVYYDASGNMSVGESATIKNVMLFDLTQMFGSTIADYIYSLEQATAGAGVAFFRKLFPENYYEYNTGTMMHVSGVSSHDMVGFNAWDEEIEMGKLDYLGNNISDTSGNNWRTKNYIPVIGGAAYYSKIAEEYTTSNSNNALCFYDAGKQFIEKQSNKGNKVTTTPSNCAYVRIEFYYTTARTSPPTGLCYNLSWDGERNGEYEPYVKHSYPLDDSLTLRGISKLDSNNQLYYDGDIYSADGTVTRKYGIVDLGTLDWTFYAATTDFPYGYFRSEISDKAYGRQNILCTKYTTGQGESLEQVDKQCLGSANTVRIYVVDSAYTDEASFEAAMSGVMLVYELAAPTTEEAEPYQELQLCDPYGTEEYVTTSLVPVGHNTKYPANLRSAIERVMEQVPEAPSANGTYTLKATRTANGVTYAWTAE